MYLVAIAWLYVALMMAVAEALHPAGTVIGAVFTFVLYGLGPVSLLMYLLATPLRRRRRQADGEYSTATPAKTTTATTGAENDAAPAPCQPTDAPAGTDPVPGTQA